MPETRPAQPSTPAAPLAAAAAPASVPPPAAGTPATEVTAQHVPVATVPLGVAADAGPDATGTRPLGTVAPAARPLGLSLTQIAGGALAAVTAAVAASYLGVAGTLLGAALASVVSSVAAALYSTSLSRAARVSKVLVVRPADGGTGPLEASAQDPSAVPPVVPAEPPAAASPWSRLRWRPVAAVAGLLFAGAMAVVSVSELALGHPLGNPADSGTTLTNLGGGTAPTTPTGDDTGDDATTPGPSPSGTPGPTVSPTGSPSPSPTGGAATATPGPTATTGAGTAPPTPGTETGTGTDTGTGTGTAPAPTPSP